MAVNGEKKVTFVAEGLAEEFELALMTLLEKYQDMFAWSYEGMFGLNTKLITHKLDIDLTIKPVKQTTRNFNNHTQLQIKKEIEKSMKAGFIKPCLHPIWLANIVLV